MEITTTRRCGCRIEVGIIMVIGELKNEYKDRSGLYFLTRNLDVGSSNSRIKDILEKVAKGIEKIKDCLKEIKIDILVINQEVRSHATIIK